MLFSLCRYHIGHRVWNLAKMKVGIIFSFLLAASPAFAGRAFPVDSEYYAGDLFSTVNQYIEWDPNNYLVDLAGRYALCKNLDVNGPIEVSEKTPEGFLIGGLTASYTGGASDSNTVHAYIKQSMPLWLQEPAFLDQIRNANTFGCSIQPNCKGRYVITCLFSGNGRLQEPTPIPKAKAFTPEQYDEAELIVGKLWDRSHLLENLSGMETDCGMIYNKNWIFTKVRALTAARGLNIEPVYGVSENLGRTQPAMRKVLGGLKYTFDKFGSGRFGCSLIPDCQYQGRMYVVASCLIST